MMDPKKLGALVEEHSKNPLADMPMHDVGESEEGEEVDMLTRGEELLTSMGEFGDELKESADIFVDNAMDIGEDLVSEEPAPETEEAAEEMADAMPGFIQEGFADQIEGKERKDLEAIGAVLDTAVESDSPEGEHTPEMAAKVGGLLEMVGKCCIEEGNPDDDDENGEGDDNPEAELADDELDDGY